jgi:malic enzyme
MAQIEDILNNIPEAYDVSAVCVTDSEAILGIGDQGVGGIVISIAKLAMYTLCAGFHPTKVLPIVRSPFFTTKSLSAIGSLSPMEQYYSFYLYYKELTFSRKCI